MTGKGFGIQGKKKCYTSIKQQLEILIEGVRLRTKNEVPIFITTANRFKVLRQIINDIAKEHPDYHFRLIHDEDCYGVCIVPRSKEKYFSCTWVEQSEITNKWRVMASTPGSMEYRCICVWKEEGQARKIAEQIFDSILRMPLLHWEQRDGKFLELLKSLPPDDDEVIGWIDNTGKLRSSILELQPRS